MHGTISDCHFDCAIETITGADNTRDLSRFVLRLPALYGVQQVAYRAYGAGGEVWSRCILAFNTFSPTWDALYAARNYGGANPVLVELERCALPLDWDGIDRGPPDVRDFFDEALRHGIGGKGCTIPIETRHGDRGVFTFTADVPDAEWPCFRRAREAELAYLAWHLHERAMTLCGRRAAPASPALSAQERRCLEHLIQAMSPKAIARAMDLSVSTVRMHLNNARLKLGCKTLPQAVAVAVRRGLVRV